MLRGTTTRETKTREGIDSTNFYKNFDEDRASSSDEDSAMSFK